MSNAHISSVEMLQGVPFVKEAGAILFYNTFLRSLCRPSPCWFFKENGMGKNPFFEGCVVKK